MNLETLRSEVADETARVLLDRHGFVPDQDSDEWEEEYRRQFALRKQRVQAGAAPSPPPPTPPPPAGSGAPPLRGAPPDARRAAAPPPARPQGTAPDQPCALLPPHLY